ncbi:MAG: rod shape-determining protein MreC [Chloroflexi bacterium]|nr:rod shape-determining protein MreC [Chloroflexota bacterium]
MALVVAAMLLGMAAVVASERGWTHAAEGAAADALAPAQRVMVGFTSFLESFVNVAVRVGQLEAENRALRSELSRVKQEMLGLVEAGQENERLRALLAYQQRYDEHDYLTAAIINRADGNHLLHAITIDRGSNDGVQDGMVVVADGGLVGRVAKSYPTVAKVLVITDPSSAVNTMVQRTRAAGVLMGSATRDLRLEYINQEEDVQPGDVIITSGLGGGFPKGIPIGMVAEASGSDLALFKTIRVQPTVALHAIEEVLVITDFTPMSLP